MFEITILTQFHKIDNFITVGYSSHICRLENRAYNHWLKGQDTISCVFSLQSVGAKSVR